MKLKTIFLLVLASGEKAVAHWGNIYREVVVRTEEGPLLLNARSRTQKREGRVAPPF